MKNGLEQNNSEHQEVTLGGFKESQSEELVNELFNDYVDFFRKHYRLELSVLEKHALKPIVSDVVKLGFSVIKGEISPESAMYNPDAEIDARFLWEEFGIDLGREGEAFFGLVKDKYASENDELDAFKDYIKNRILTERDHRELI